MKNLILRHVRGSGPVSFASILAYVQEQGPVDAKPHEVAHTLNVLIQAGEVSLYDDGVSFAPTEKPLLTSNRYITANHPIREAVAGLSTRGKTSYYANMGEFRTKAETVLQQYGLAPVWDTFCVFGRNDCGHDSTPLRQGIMNIHSYLFVSWYRMPSGNLEVTTYITY